jgi:hypothetical protein
MFQGLLPANALEFPFPFLIRIPFQRIDDPLFLVEMFVEENSHGARSALKFGTDEVPFGQNLVFHTHPRVVPVIRLDPYHPPVSDMGLENALAGPPAIAHASRVNRFDLS